MSLPALAKKLWLRVAFELPASLMDAYSEWYGRLYGPEVGDLVTNTTHLSVSTDREEPVLRAYSFPASRDVPAGTCMVYIGPHLLDEISVRAGHILRFDGVDAVLPKYLIDRISVISKKKNARG